MNELTDRVAAALAGMGVKKGDRIGIFMPNTPQFVIAYFGVLKAGGVVVATNPLYSAREIEYQVNDAGIEIMLVMSNYYNLIKKAQSNTKIRKVIVTNIKEYLPPLLAFLFGLTKEKKGGFRVDLAAEDIWFKDFIAPYKPEDRPKLDIGPDDVALFQYSGGTTGVSKGAIALHRNLVANALQIRYWMPGAIDGARLYDGYSIIPCLWHGRRNAVCNLRWRSMVMIPNPRLADEWDLQNIKQPSFPACPPCIMQSTTTRMPKQENII
jgi:long-chain acyl-CoA synthetase